MAGSIHPPNHVVDRIAGQRFALMSAAVGASVLAALVFIVESAGATERCCFLVDAAVAGHGVGTAGSDLESPGAYVYRARWGWRVRHIARYVEHGRIFNALTALGPRPSPSLVSFRFSETRRSIRGPTCRRRLQRPAAMRGDRAYVSLEDAPDGRIALVVHTYLFALRARCNSSFVIPLAHVARAPAGVKLRQAPVVSLGWRERVSAPHAIRATVTVRVRLRFVPERLARRFARRDQG